MNEREAWEVLRDAIHAKENCPDWETASNESLTRAEAQVVSAIRALQEVGNYLEILEVTTFVECESCVGTGRIEDPDEGIRKCLDCRGEGQVPETCLQRECAS